MNKIAQHLLDDDAMQRFIVDGYLTLQSEQPRAYHARMYDALEPLDETGPLGHNNLLPCVPELRTMLDEPKVVGALTSLLGPDYYLHFHRHDHVNYPDGAQSLHKDGDIHSHIASDGLRRYHPTRFVMLLYYPQDTPLEAGPTGIVPRSQYLTRRALDQLRSEADQRRSEIYGQMKKEMDADAFRGTERFKRYAEMERELLVRHPDLVAQLGELSAPWEDVKIPLSGDAGTVSIVHFDIVHGRYCGNQTGKQRHMVKFLFSRNEEPAAPTWDHASRTWRGPEDDCQTPIWKHVWSWHLGIDDTATSKQSVDDLALAFAGSDDAIAIGAAYELGSTSSGMKMLFDRFYRDDPNIRSIAAYGLVRAGKQAVPELLTRLAGADADLAVRILDVIGDIGPRAAEAVPQVTTLSASPEPSVRRASIEALGLLTQQQTTLQAAVVASLSRALDDEDAIVVRNATFAISRLGAKACTEGIVDQLYRNLGHWHHHVRGWSIEALQRLDDPRALNLALRYLMAARWDPAAKSGDRDVTAETMRASR